MEMTLTSILDLGVGRKARERRIWMSELAEVQQLSFERMLRRQAAEEVEESAQLLAVG
jgi:hypothetical protein